MPAVLDGMDKAEALAYVSRLFDAAQAGAVLWGDALLIKRFISQCSRTGSKATQDGYRFEIREFTRWRDRHHPHLHLREINPAFCQDWVSLLREQVDAGLMNPGRLTAGLLPSAPCTDGPLNQAAQRSQGCRVTRCRAALCSMPRRRLSR